MTTLTADQMYAITNLAELDPNAATSTYSGRGMYGEKCVGWDCDSMTEILRLGAAITTIMGDDAPDMTYAATSDSMGMGTIVYFPDFTCDTEIGEDDDDDE